MGIKITDGDIRGFEQIPDGWWNVEVLDGVKYTALKDKEGNVINDERGTPKESNTLQIPCKLVDADIEARTSVFCKLDSSSGRSRLASVMFYAGISAKIAKKKGWKDLDQEEWDDSLFLPNSPMVREVMAKLPNHRMRCEIKTTKRGENEYQNVITLDRYNGVANPTKQEGAKAQPESSATDAGGDDW